jgi:Ca2+:H+ antiporter
MTKSKPAPYSPHLPGKFRVEPMHYLLLALPAAVALELSHASPVAIFLVSCLAIIPLAGLMGRATEYLAETMGAGVGGLLNATFGNAAELIIAVMALRRASGNDPHDPMFQLVKASITGSIIGNILLVLGVSIVAGGLFYKKQTFNRTGATMGATLLTLAAIALLVPAAHWYLSGAAHDEKKAAEVVQLSEEIAAVLIVVYGFSLLFSLRTHSHLFGETKDSSPIPGGHPQPEWGRGTSLLVLLGATAGVAVMSEFLVGSVGEAAQAMGMSNVFVGVIVVAVIGNAAEHSTAVLVAMKNKMDLTVNIAIGSSMQIALFVAPVLVFTSLLMGHSPALDLHFTALETLAVLASILVLGQVAADGETHWMEGVMLLAVYGILALAFYHV